MKWDDKYCIGVEHIDRQHKGLFTAINRVSTILEENDMEKNRRACIEAIKYLKNYTLQHFADEEAYQRKINYPGYEQHQKLHDAFVANLLEREKDMQQNNYSRISVQRFMDMVSSWLVNHIMSADQKITRGPKRSLFQSLKKL